MEKAVSQEWQAVFDRPVKEASNEAQKRWSGC